MKYSKGSKEIQRYTLSSLNSGRIHQSNVEPNCICLLRKSCERNRFDLNIVTFTCSFWRSPINIYAKFRSKIPSKKKTRGTIFFSRSPTQGSKSYARCVLKPKRLYRTTANWTRFTVKRRDFLCSQLER